MARYQVILAYDGTDYHGFQRQATGRTVQAVVEAALSAIGWTGRSILAAGRTDSGVHALGQVIAFDLDWRHTDDNLRDALNAHLPADVAVQVVHKSAPDFHPRFAATTRCYWYRLYNSPVPDPLEDRLAWRIWPAADLQRLNRLAGQLLGKHDFAAFGTPPKRGGKTVRDISVARWWEEPFHFPHFDEQAAAHSGHRYRFEIAADGFLYRMVRRLVYIQVVIAQGRLPVETMQCALENPPAAPLEGLAPACGLYLVNVNYPPATVEE